MKLLFYLLSLVPKSLFEYLIDIYLSLGLYKYSSGFKVTLKNIEIAFPGRNKKDVTLLAKRSFKESIISGYESIYTWARNDAEVNSNILRIENNYLINNLKESGLIAVSFHNRSVDMLLAGHRITNETEQGKRADIRIHGLNTGSGIIIVNDKI